MNPPAESQFLIRRKAMGLSQRGAAAIVEKIYGVKLSHSYLSLIERGQVGSIGAYLKKALLDFYKINTSPDTTAVCPGGPHPAREIYRIPLFEETGVVSYLDLTGPELADFALLVGRDLPEMGFFSGDLLICRKTKPLAGELAVVKKSGRYTYIYAKSDHSPDTLGTVVTIMKKTPSFKHHQAVLDAAAAQLSEEALISELSTRNGLKKKDLIRSLEVLRNFSKKESTGDKD